MLVMILLDLVYSNVHVIKLHIFSN